MTWEFFYLICFVIGFVFSVLSFLAGTMHLPFAKHFHFGGMAHGSHAGLGGHATVAHAPVGSHGPVGHGAAGSHAPAHGSAAKGQIRSGGRGSDFPFLNPMTLAAFLTWFGGTGYLLEHLRHIWVFAGLGLSAIAGLAGASIVFLFVAKVLMARDYTLDPMDYEMVGVLGRISSSIRPEGTGEIIFIQQGSRRGCAARTESGESLPKGLEVVVTRYEKGVAYVKPWTELADSAGIPTEQEQTKE
jgi:membrane protein implicated in regulation of membrane protease activity